jgi:hypothetical protein
MSAIEFSEQDYAAIKRAAAAEGMPLDAWIVAHLPLDAAASEPAEAAPCPEAKPAKTMADLFAGRLGRFNSGNGQPSSNNIGEHFADYLEEKHRMGRL